MDELTIGDKVYISSKQAAKITGYAKDYVGQLCREGRVDAKLVGRNWFVLEASIREHRFGAESAAVPAPVREERPDEKPEIAPVSTWEAPQYAPIEEEALIPPLEAVKKATPAPDTAEAVALMQDAWREWFETRQKASADVDEAHDADIPAADIAEVEEEYVELEEAVRISDMSSIYATEEVSREREENHPIHVTRVEEEAPIEEEYVSVVPVRERETIVTPRSTRPQSHGSVIDLSQPRRMVPEAPVRPSTRVQRRRKAHRTPLAVHALIFAIAGLTAVGAVIGSGAADNVLSERGLNDSLRGAVFDALRGESRIEK
jgi:hypothetical protein